MALKLKITLAISLALIKVSVGVPVESFFPFGTENGDSIALKGDDIFTGPLPLKFEFPFFNNSYPSLFVNVNGGVSFRQGISQFTPTCGAIGPESTMIAPYWGDVHTGLGGDLFYRESTNRTLLLKAQEEIQKEFPELWSFNPAWIFVATWYDVAFFGSSSNCNGDSKRNTFQLVLVTDGSLSFAIFNYDKLQWTTGTASGGDCNGLGGNAAKSGFDVGDGHTFYEIAGSCSAQVLDIAQSTNSKDAAGSPGKWIFRVDSALESSGCNSDKYDKSGANPEKLRMSPSFVSSLGHVPVNIEGPCLADATSATCRFIDNVEPALITEVTATIIPETNLAICEVPFLYSYGRVAVELVVQEMRGERTYQGYLYSQEAQTTVVAEVQNGGRGSGSSSGSGALSEITLTWDASAFPNDQTFDLILMEASTSLSTHDARWGESEILAEGVANTGSYTFQLSLAGLQDLVAFQLKFEFAVQSAFSNTLLGLSGLNDAAEAQARCESWYETDAGISVTATNGIEPCPPLLEQAQRDSRFEVENYGTPSLAFYHPNAVASYRQRTPNQQGAGQQCVYQQNGELIVGPTSGGTIDLGSPNHRLDILSHYTNDILPWTFCCGQSGSASHCGQYYERRASDSGALYVPPRPARAAGDPHITTFDNTSYTLNAVGEFWMVKTSNGEFSMQARMEPFVNGSVFTAFVMDDGQTRVQVELKRPNGLNVLLNGEVVTFDLGRPNRILTESASVERVDNSTIELSFTKGFGFSIEASTEALGLMAQATDANKGKVTGLLGYFDGNGRNDLKAPDNTETAVTANLRDIHHNFGMKWATKNGESLFVYPQGKAHGDFSAPDFVPRFEEPNLNEIPDDIQRMCGGYRECLFDYQATGDAAFANVTRVQTQKFQDVVRGLGKEKPACKPITSLANGFVVANNFFFSSSVNFGCSAGYRLVGPKTIYCIAGTGAGASKAPRWNASTPKCVKQ